MPGRTDRRRPRRLRPWLAAGVLVAAGVGLLALVWIAVRPPPGQVLSVVEVAGEPVGGMDEGALRQHVQGVADRRGVAPVVAAGLDDEVTSTRAEVGEAVDVEATVEAAMRRGRQRSPVTAARDLLADRRDEPIAVPLRVEVDHAAVSAWADDTAARLSTGPRDADLELLDGDDGPEVSVTEAAVGSQADALGLRDRLLTALRSDDRAVRIDVPEEPRAPRVDDDDVAAILDDAESLVADAITLAHPLDGLDDVTLQADELVDLVEVARDDREDAQPLRLRPLADRVADRLAEDRDDLERDPEEAEIRLDGDEVVIEGGQRGFALDPPGNADRLLEAARDDDRTAELAGEMREPDRSREDAEALGIIEPVSEFTTEHACCEPRVDNIQLMAELVAGTVVEPEERFSLNDHVGPRTEEAGFVEGGVIIDGEFEDAVGGGVSQFATTFFNAAFFAGVQLVEFQPHSYYISRYPEGREATLSYGVLDVAFVNDTDYGILIDTDHTDTSITVTFWSTDHRQVEADDSGRQNVEAGEVRDGFDITFSRIVRDADGDVIHDDEWFHRYQPEDQDDDPEPG